MYRYNFIPVLSTRVFTMDRFKVTKSEPKEYYESTDDDDGEGKTVTSSLLEMKELNGPRYEGKNLTFVIIRRLSLAIAIRVFDTLPRWYLCILFVQYIYDIHDSPPANLEGNILKAYAIQFSVDLV